MSEIVFQILITIASAYLLIAFVHVSYIYVVSLQAARKKNKLHWFVYLFAIPTIVFMLPFYWLLNISLGSLLFLEFPRSLAFTKRCQRHMNDDTWRGKLARFWCKNFLDPFEDGGHC